MKTKKQLLTCILLSLSLPSYSDDLPKACQGGMAAMVDRPSVAYNACTIPAKTLFIEAGYSYQVFSSATQGYNIPQSEIRLGLTNHTEFDMNAPNYIYQADSRQTGFTAFNLGLKHEFYYDDKQLLTLHGYFTPTSGSYYYGTARSSFLLQSIYSYSFPSGVSLAGTLGFASNASTPADPAPLFYTFNPIIDFGGSFNDKVSYYLELYAQSKTAINQGWGLSFDGGILTQITKNVMWDVSAGQRMVGYQNNVDHYFDTGFTLSIS